MNYVDYYNLLKKYNLITDIWKYELELIKGEMHSQDDDCLILLLIYFSRINAGNVCLPLDKDELKEKWEKQINDAKILYEEKENFDVNEFDLLKQSSFMAINSKLDSLASLNIIGSIFIIDNNYLYLRKYYYARKGKKDTDSKGIIGSIESLFLIKPLNKKEAFRLEDSYRPDKPDFSLKENQALAAKSGLNKNLIITGGPGTGKTTAILYILLYILADDPSYTIKLAAASGKAASRMKESLVKGIDDLNEKFKQKYQNIINKIMGTLNSGSNNDIEEFTIHRLLNLDSKTGKFRYNKNNQFDEKTIFVIDEASMIDICLFNNLLDAIPKGARVFILGDKDQLPSVEVGSVFGDMVKSERLQNNVIRLVESVRFKEGTEIYDLAYKVNNGLSLDLPKFRDVPLEKNDTTKKGDSSGNDDSLIKDFSQDAGEKSPVYYYLNEGEGQKKRIERFVSAWAKTFYNDLQDKASDLVTEASVLYNNDKTGVVDELFKAIEYSKILCAENEGIRGVKSINHYVKKLVIDKKKTPVINYHYAGEIMMINKNNKALELYNGDTGILVSFKDDDMLYLAVKKSTNRISAEGYKKDEIFKMGDYIFYPFRMLSMDEISLAYAITVHKSQGSDYRNISVILPTSIGHPLLNRQILYTAITRTKGNTFILSSPDRLEEAKGRLIERDTNIY